MEMQIKEQVSQDDVIIKQWNLKHDSIKQWGIIQHKWEQLFLVERSAESKWIVKWVQTNVK